MSVSATNYRENRRSIYADAEFSDVCLRGMTDPDNLSELERYRFRLLMSNMMDAQLDMYVQTVVTGFSPETWATQGQGVVRRVMTTPGGRWFWSQYRGDYTAACRREVDRMLDPAMGHIKEPA